MLGIGELAPDFRGTDQNGHEVRLADLLKKGPVVLYFFPRAFTPGCNFETRAFAQKHDDFARYGAEVVAVSTDTPEQSSKFACDYGGNFPMLPDTNGSICKAYGVLGMFGTANRITYVIAPDGKIVAKTDYSLRATKHVVDALTTLKQLEKR